jgi:hypothetical protein
LQGFDSLLIICKVRPSWNGNHKHIATELIVSWYASLPVTINWKKPQNPILSDNNMAPKILLILIWSWREDYELMISYSQVQACLHDQVCPGHWGPEQWGFSSTQGSSRDQGRRRLDAPLIQSELHCQSLITFFLLKLLGALLCLPCDMKIKTTE